MYDYDAVYPANLEFTDDYEIGTNFYNTDGEMMSVFISENTGAYDAQEYLEQVRASEPRISYSYFNDEKQYVGYTYYEDSTKAVICYGVACVSPTSVVTMLFETNAVGDGECSDFGNKVIDSMLDFARS